MANTVNLGSVVEPKPTLTKIDSSTELINNLDSKNRIIVKTSAIVTGEKYIRIMLNSDVPSYTMHFFITDTDAHVYTLTAAPQDTGATFSTFQIILPTPFDYSLELGSITSAVLIEKGSMWS